MRIRQHPLGPLLAAGVWLALAGAGCPSAGIELRQRLDRGRMAYDRGDILAAYRLLRQEQIDEPGDAGLAGEHERLLARVTRATEHLVERWLQQAERWRAAGDLPRALRYLDDLLAQLPAGDGLRQLVTDEAQPIRSELERLRAERDRLLNEARRQFAHGEFEAAHQLFLEARWLAREHHLDFDLRHERLLTECSRRAPGELETLVEAGKPAVDQAGAGLEGGGQVAGDIGTGPLGLGEQTAWLALISVVVCVVGIANVMLMAVAERFREIATLKCLGALDGFIMVSFVLEAALLGMVGGVVGALGGMVIGTGRALAAFGRPVVTAFPVGIMAQAMGGAVVVGVVLAAVAAVYPSYRAAGLPPMEAMRIE